MTVSSAGRVQPRSHWLLLVIVLGLLGAAMLIHGVVNHEVAPGEGPPGETNAEPAPAAAELGPVLDARQSPPKSWSPRPGRVALTFDDGPDPTWTPRILDVLEHYHVPATFFVIGSRVTERPDLVRRAIRGGSEIGVHTFTHSDLGRIGRFRAGLELSQTQAAIAGATGLQTSILRLPYASTADSVSESDFSAMVRAADDRYLSVFATHDPQDWDRPGVATIVQRATPTGGEGAIIVLHDGGGDRAQTVAAVEELIPRLQRAGYTFTTLGDAVGIPKQMSPAATGVLWQGRLLLWSVKLADLVVTGLKWALVAVGVLTLVRVLLLLLVAPGHVIRDRRRRRDRPVVLEPVSVVVPAHNEAAGIARTVDSLIGSEYPDLEVIVVDDGSVDGTAEIVEQQALPRVRVVRQPNLGKAAALETGIAHARSELVVLVDGDTLFEPSTIYRLVQPFADPGVGAVSGNAKVGNRRGLLGHWQHIEYVMSFNLDRRLYDVLGCMTTVPGAVGAYRRQALDHAGGLQAHTLAEDSDVTMSVTRAGWQVRYEETARAWTEAPATLGQLWRQRYRWCYGTLQAVWKHRGAVLGRGPSGRLGRRGLIYLVLFQVLLPLLAPIVDLAALYGLVFLDPLAVGVAWLCYAGIQTVVAAYAFYLDREPITPLWSVPLQQLLYRQLMYLVVIQSLVTAVAGAGMHWHKLDRRGTAEVAQQP
ncbi:MAG: bifunctional polysaccharide deacetylase/glycosyltransferase family 2 protein, partial [Actinomycetes bacterium]